MQRAKSVNRASCEPAGRYGHEGEDTNAVALHAMRDDVMLCTLFGIISTLNTPRAGLGSELRQRVMLPPVFNREIEFIDYDQDKFAKIRCLLPQHL